MENKKTTKKKVTKLDGAPEIIDTLSKNLKDFGVTIKFLNEEITRLSRENSILNQRIIELSQEKNKAKMLELERKEIELNDKIALEEQEKKNEIFNNNIKIAEKNKKEDEEIAKFEQKANELLKENGIIVKKPKQKRKL